MEIVEADYFKLFPVEVTCILHLSMSVVTANVMCLWQENRPLKCLPWSHPKLITFSMNLWTHFTLDCVLTSPPFSCFHFLNLASSAVLLLSFTENRKMRN